MLVTELRGKLLTKMEEAAASGDEVGAALVCAYARAMLVALVSHAEDAEVEPQNLEVGTGTAAVILGLHPEYVRSLVRRGGLPATKQNGEHRIPLSAVAAFTAAGARSRSDAMLARLPGVGGLVGGWWSELPGPEPASA